MQVTTTINETKELIKKWKTENLSDSSRQWAFCTKVMQA